MSTHLATDYNSLLVLLSVVIAMLASYTTLDLAERVTATKAQSQLGWLISGAAAMGIGIWSMHFIGMLALRLPLIVHYDFVGVLISILPAILAAALALFVVSRPVVSWISLSVGSVCMGAGIATMHYLGMAAMRTDAAMQYDRRLVLLSIVIAIAVAWLGLFLAAQLREEGTPHQVWGKFLAAILIGTAIPTMHYTGMAAVQFVPQLETTITAVLRPPANTSLLVISVIVGTLIILGITLLSAFFDRRLAAQVIYSQALKENQKYLKAILQGIQVGVIVTEAQTTIKFSNQALLDLLHLSTESELQALWNQVAIAQIDAKEPEQSNHKICHELQSIVQKTTHSEPIKNTIIQVNHPTVNGLTSLMVNAVALELDNPSQIQTIYTFSEITELIRTEERLQESEARFRALAKQEELLNYLSTQIRQSLDLQTILQTAVYEVRNFFKTDRALIYQFDANWCGQVVLEDVIKPWSSVLGEATNDCFPKACLERYQNGDIRAIDNTVEEGLNPSHLAFLKRLQVQAILIVPIMVQEQLWGLLIVHQCSTPRKWKPTEGDLLSRLAIQLGIAIQQSQLYTQAEHNALQAQHKAQELRLSQTQLQQKADALTQTLQERQKLQLQLVQSEKMSSLGQLVAGIAHEINNPVNFIHGNLPHLRDYAQEILGCLQLYQSKYPKLKEAETADLAFIQEDLGKILKSMAVGTDRIRQIVLSLRNFARMDEAELKAVNIHEGLDSTLMILQHRLKASSSRPGIDVIREYTDLPLVECYPGQLNQVFMNLLSNAVDALEEYHTRQSQLSELGHPGQIQLRTHVTEQQWVQVTIADNGPGIPPAVKERIFEPFFTTKPVGKGTGMGLSISYQIIVEKHRGKLDCISVPHQGTEFLLQIPIQQTRQHIT